MNLRKHINERINESFKQILSEDPDTVHFLNPKDGSEKTLRFHNSRAVAFIADLKENKLFIGKPMLIHADLINTILVDKNKSGEIDLRSREEYEKWLDYYEDNTIHGRIWLISPYVISFYTVPEPSVVSRIITMLDNKIEETYGFKIPLDNTYLDTGVRDDNGLDKIVPITDYLNNDNIETRDSEKVPHFMDADEKRKDQNMGQYLKDKVKNQADKLTNDKGVEMTRAEYNALRRPYSESKLINNEPMLDGETTEDYFNRMAHKLVWGTNKFKKDSELHTSGTPEEKVEKYGGAIKNRYDKLSDKLGNMPEVEYRYLKGENKNRPRQITLTEAQLKQYINEQINELKYNKLYEITKKSLNEVVGE